MPAKIALTGLFLAILASVSLLQAQSTGKITGKVLEGERPQPGLNVVLSDNDGKEKATTKTSDKGEFEFKDLAAGNYKVFSSKPVSGRKGMVSVVVQADKTSTVVISLLQ